MSQKIDSETAEREFERFLDAMGLTDKCDPEGMDDESLEDFRSRKRGILKQIERGRIVIDDAGQLTFEAGQEKIVFYKPKGKVLAAMDFAKADRNVEKQNRLLAAMTQRPRTVFEEMDLADYYVCSSVMALILAPR